MKKSFKRSIINAGKIILTVMAVPFMLAAILIWSAATFGKMAMAALFKRRKFSAG